MTSLVEILWSTARQVLRELCIKKWPQPHSIWDLLTMYQATISSSIVGR